MALEKSIERARWKNWKNDWMTRIRNEIIAMENRWGLCGKIKKGTGQNERHTRVICHDFDCSIKRGGRITGGEFFKLANCLRSLINLRFVLDFLSPRLRVRLPFCRMAVMVFCFCFSRFVLTFEFLRLVDRARGNPAPVLRVPSNVSTVIRQIFFPSPGQQSLSRCGDRPDPFAPSEALFRSPNSRQWSRSPLPKLCHRNSLEKSLSLCLAIYFTPGQRNLVSFKFPSHRFTRSTFLNSRPFFSLFFQHSCLAAIIFAKLYTSRACPRKPHLIIFINNALEYFF